MEKILEKLESIIEGFLANLEKEPVKTSIKLLILYWVIKTIYKDLKGR